MKYQDGESYFLLQGDTSMTLKGVQLLTEQFKGMLISYDEVILCSIILEMLI